jgi:SPP1 gp7 family putative phage head morphogenesis protein
MSVPRLAKRPKRLPKPPRRKYAVAAERKYESALQRYTSGMHRLLLQMLLPELRRAYEALRPPVPAQKDSARLDDDESTIVGRVFDLLSRIRLEWEKEVPQAQLDLLANDIGRDVSAVSKESLRGQIKAVLGLDPLLSDRGAAAQLAIFRKANVEMIRSIDQRYFDEISGIVQRGLAAGTRPEQMAEDFEARYQVSRSRANLIARDQTAKLHGQLDRVRQTDLGIKHYIWRTAKDQRVRDEHAEREGEVFSWDDPPEGGHPGEDYQCRCYAEPMIEELLDELEAGEPLAEAA